jgi:hypothetical protein
MLVWQCKPLNPGGQAHAYALTPSVQVPPFWHGVEAHSLMSV